MKNLIKGDIRRIMCKKGFWIVFAVSLAVLVAVVIFSLNYMLNSSFVFATSLISGLTEFSSIIIGVAVFMGCYADDFKAMTIITVIGRGRSRKKIIIAKFINSVILSALLYALMFIFVVIFTKVMGMTLLPDETLVLYLGVFKGFFLTVGYVTMAAVAIYATGNIPFSIFCVVMFYMILPTALQLTSLLPVVKNFHLSRYDYNGLATTGLSSIVLGMPAKGIFMLILDFVIYVGGAIAIIYAVFRKKELDF